MRHRRILHGQLPSPPLVHKMGKLSVLLVLAGAFRSSPLLPPSLSASHVHSLSMFVDMHVNILWGKFVKMTYINENLIKHWSLIFDFILLINFEL